MNTMQPFMITLGVWLFAYGLLLFGIRAFVTHPQKHLRDIVESLKRIEEKLGK